MFIVKNNDLIILVCDTQEELKQALKFMNYDSIEETDIEYRLVDGVYLTADEAEAKERERINGLKLTKRVFALALQELGITYSQLKSLIDSNEQAQLEWDLCVELERSNPLLDIMAEEVGLSSDMLDYIFRKANGEGVEIPAVEVHTETTEGGEAE